MRSLLRIFVYAGVFAVRFYFSQSKRKDGWAFRYLFVLLNVAAAVSLPFALYGSPIAVALLASFLLLAYPWLVARAVFIRFGLWRGAFAFGWLARVTWGEHGDGAAVAAAWAIHRRKSERGARAVARRLARSKFSSANVLAAGILASARGDRAGMRTLLESLQHLEASDHRLAHRTAGELLLADAASEGDWRRVRRLAASWEPSSRLTWFLGAVAMRLTATEASGEPPSDATLIRSWLFAPRRLATLSLLRMALRSASQPTPDSSSWPAPRDLDVATPTDPLGRALALHLHLGRTGHDAVELDELIVLGRAWDDVHASGELEALTLARGADLESRSPDAVAAEFLRDIESDIASTVRLSGHRLDLLPGDSPCLSRAAAKVREDMLGVLELALSNLEIRTSEESLLPPIDEWREFLALRALHAEVAQTGGMAVRRLAFPQLHHALCNHAAWLWNSCNEFTLSGALFQWLLAEATVVGDSRAIELQRKNCDVAD